MNHLSKVTCSLFTAVAISNSSDAATLANPGFTVNTFAANDDGSLAVPINFTIDFFGTSYNSLFINNNGNVTFESPLNSFTPLGLETVDFPIIAPFFADVDTTVPGSGVVTYGNDVVDGRAAFGVNWFDVAYFGSSTNIYNRFQLLIIDRSDIGVGNFDIRFNYDNIDWETGSASGGDANGLGGSSARIGYSNGDGTFFEFPGSGVNGAFLSGGEFDLVGTTMNVEARNGALEPTLSTVPEPGVILPLMAIFAGATVTFRSRRS